MATSAQFTTISTEGGLLPSDLISRLVNDTPSLPGTREEDYRLTPGRQLREIINRSWNDLLGAWQVFQPQIARLSPDDHTATLTWDRWLLPLFTELGYGRLERFPETLTIGDKDYPISHHHDHSPVHLVGWNVRLDRRTAGVVGAARAAPHSMVQELLNRTDEYLWAVLSNGRQLRILRDNSSLTRAAYVEFDLEQMFSEGVFTDFVALWLLVHASRVEGDPQDTCWLETWASEARQQGVRALDTLGQGFEEAIETLGQGFLVHPANGALRDRLRDGNLSRQDYYRQLLRVVYRLVFLLVTEDRSLLHPPDASTEARERYARYYSLSRIRDLARRRRGTKHSDLWDQILIVARSLGSEGQGALGLPALNSGLWSDEGMSDLSTARLANTHLLAAVRSLAYARQDQALHRIDYRNLGSEELGSVYESLLELKPKLDPSAGTFSLGHAAGNERKTSGSYYTPTSLISSLLDSALDPVLDEAMSKVNPEKALLELKILDPACGSGHFLVAAAQRIARRLAMLRTGETDPAPDVFRHALREVVSRCLYGIDVNPMALELTKVNLWLMAVDPGRPLSFLDHHLVCGNSLLGTTPALLGRGVPDQAFTPLTGDNRAVASAWKKANQLERSGQISFIFAASPGGLADSLATGIAAIDAIAGDDAAQIHEQERRFADLQGSMAAARAKLHADAWCAAFVAPKTKGAPVITDAVVRRIASDPATVEAEVLDLVRALAAQFQFLHLHLAFPTVFRARPHIHNDDVCGWDGGFSVVLGNPPWERVKASDREFFASIDPEVALAPAAHRRRMIAALLEQSPALATEFERVVRHGDGESLLLRSSDRFPLCGLGRDINTFAVFAELMRNVIGPTGRVGMIVPTGIATDDTTKFFFADCVDRQSLVSLYDFENAKPLFTGVHRSYKFCLLTLSGTERPANAAEFAFFLHDPADLAESDRRFTLSSTDIALINPNTKTAAVFRSARAAQLTLGIYRRFPVLLTSQGHSTWSPRTRPGLFHMGNDAPLFLEPDDRDAKRLYEAKFAHQFDHRWATMLGSEVTEVAVNERTDPNYRVTTRYGVPRSIVSERLVQERVKWLFGFRDITNTTNERSAIFFALPPEGVGDNIKLLFLDDATPVLKAALLALMNSFILDFVVRQKMNGTHLSMFLLWQLPVPPPAVLKDECVWAGGPLSDWLALRVLELTYTAWDLEGFGQDLGYHGPPFRWDPSRRNLLRAELDAACFQIYGVERDDIDYVMESFPIVKKKDMALFGEYRTKRMVLECFEAIAEAKAAEREYETVLYPRPAHPSLSHHESTRPAS
jgi:hypothetical protein